MFLIRYQMDYEYERLLIKKVKIDLLQVFRLPEIARLNQI